MDTLLDADDDYIERLRRSIYPRLHRPLTSLGDVVGVPLYAVGKATEEQYVTTLNESEDAIEDELDDRAQRNPIAAYKTLSDGRESEGSWVIRYEDAPDLVPKGMQLHFTLFATADGSNGRAIFAHLEDDWRVSPLKHLRSANYDASQGVLKAQQFLDEHTYLLA